MNIARKAIDAWRWHSFTRHLVAPIWLRLPEAWRWEIAYRLNASQKRCWCHLVDAAIGDREQDACDVHLPFGNEMDCDRRCGWGGHQGEHDCSCYCGKFEFVAMTGSADDRAAS